MLYLLNPIHVRYIFKKCLTLKKIKFLIKYPFQKTKRTCFNAFSIDDVINFKIYFRLSSKAMNKWRKKVKTEIQNFEYLENEKSFLHEIKNIFHRYF